MPSFGEWAAGEPTVPIAAEKGCLGPAFPGAPEPHRMTPGRSLGKSMSLEPLLRAPLAVQIYFATVMPAFVLGTWQIFFSRKGAPLHRAIGYIYLTLMTITAITTLFVHQLMPHSPFYGLSPVHLLVPLTLFGVVGALHGAWTHNIREHRISMISLYVGGILIAGSLTFLPHRIMHAVAFGM